MITVDSGVPRCGGLHSHESAAVRAGLSMIVVDRCAMTTPIHHDHGNPLHRTSAVIMAGHVAALTDDRGEGAGCRGGDHGVDADLAGVVPAPGMPRHRRPVPVPVPVRADRLSPSWAPSFRATSYLRPVYTPPGPRTGWLAGAQFPGAAVYAPPTARTIRPPDRAAAAGNDPGRRFPDQTSPEGE